MRGDLARRLDRHLVHQPIDGFKRPNCPAPQPAIGLRPRDPMASSTVRPRPGTREGPMLRDAPGPGRLARIRAAVSDALRWDDASKALLIELLVDVPLILATLRLWYLLEHPGAEPYLDRGTMRLLFWICASYPLRLPIVIPLGLALPRSPRWGRALPP